MRLIAAAGSLLFAYLALVPAGLVAATADPACAGGGCETGLAGKLLLIPAYGAAFLALAASALALALYAIRPSANGEARIRRALAAAALAAGVALLVLLALAEPVATTAIGALGAGCYAALSRWRKRTTLDPATNGRGHPDRAHGSNRGLRAGPS